jgi:hypothetical protein
MSMRATRRRLRGRLAVSLTLALLAALSLFGPAYAALDDVTVDPGHAPPGTTITISGWACPPGLLVNPSRAGVLILTLGVSIDVPVPPSGAWSAQFVIPQGALPGAHAIVATCTRDLVPLPYLPLAVTVDAPPAPPPPPPSTTIDTGVDQTTTTLAPTTTTPPPPTTEGPNTTTTLAPGAVGGGPGSTAGPSRPTTTTGAATTTTAAPDEAVTTTVADGAVAAGRDGVQAARRGTGARGRALVFGALSPIGHGWMVILLWALIAAALVSALLAILWFRWLRHTRAREWWVRWHNQVLRIRAHARPPA